MGQPDRDSQTTMEAGYKFVLRRWISILPDFQCIWKPSGNRLLGDAPVLAQRLVFDHEFSRVESLKSKRSLHRGQVTTPGVGNSEYSSFRSRTKRTGNSKPQQRRCQEIAMPNFDQSQATSDMVNGSARISTVLAVGASGKFAGFVLPELVKRGAKVRGLVREQNEEATVRQHGASEIVVADLRDRASMNAALRGVDFVFYIAPAFMPNEAKVGEGVVEAAKQAGVRRFVFSAVIHPVLGRLSNHAAKAPVEEAILVSDMEYTFLQPAMFLQNYAESWPNVVKTGVLAEPWSTQTRFSRVDYRDVAEVAAIALTEDRLLYGTFELCSEVPRDRVEVARIISEVLRREVKADVAKPPVGDEAAQNPQQAAMKPMLQWYDKHGLMGNALTLQAILGRQPRTMKSYFEELAST